MKEKEVNVTFCAVFDIALALQSPVKFAQFFWQYCKLRYSKFNSRIPSPDPLRLFLIFHLDIMSSRRFYHKREPFPELQRRFFEDLGGGPIDTGSMIL